MSKILRKALVAGPVALGAVLAASGDAVANEFESASDLLRQIESYSAEGNGSLGQSFPGASQFSDVSPSDWAFQALDDLVRRYDCLKGYPDGTYRGNRSLSRYEFAAGLNACLQQIERLIAETTAEFVTRDDLEVLRRLLQEFEAELATLGSRVDNLEGRVAFLEDNQFSTTTKLQGEVIGEFNGVLVDRKAYTLNFNNRTYQALLDEVVQGFNNPALGRNYAGNQLASILNGTGMGEGLFEQIGIRAGEGQQLSDLLAGNVPTAAFAGGRDAFVQNLTNDLIALQTGGTGSRKADDNLVFGYRARLNFVTSFFGTDRLRTRLQARNMNSLLFNNLGTTQAVRNNGGPGNNAVSVAKLDYRFQVTPRVRALITARGASIDDILDSGTTAPYSGNNLALANSYNTLLYETGAADQAFGLNIAVNNWLGVDLGYLVAGGNDARRGLFGGDYTLPIQLNINASDRFKVALAYSRSYRGGGSPVGGPIGNAGGDTSSWLGANPFLFVNTAGNIRAAAASTNVYAFNASWDPLDWMNLSGYVGYATSVAESGPRFGDRANYWAWGFNFGFPDVAKPGDVIVAGFGKLPTVTVRNGPDDPDTSYIANLEYRFPLTRNIELAPGAYAIFNPNGIAANDTIFVGMFRTTLRF